MNTVSTVNTYDQMDFTKQIRIVQIHVSTDRGAIQENAIITTQTLFVAKTVFTDNNDYDDNGSIPKTSNVQSK